MVIEPGLPDGIFSNQKYHFGLILDNISLEDVGLFFAHLVYFVAMWSIL
jgi:hypothetical protein